jgi:precorrin-4 C11-methyltransferase
MAQKKKNNTRAAQFHGMVYFIGAGPGDPKLLTIRAHELIEKADVIIYAGSLVNPQVLSHARTGAEIIDSSSLHLEQITDAMITAAHTGKTIARLHTGDPSVYGAIREQMDILDNAGVAYAVIPGVTSAFAAAAALQKEFTVPGISQTLIIARRSGRTPVPERECLASLAAHRASMAIYLSTGMIDETLQELIDGGYPADTPAAVVYRASWDDEIIIRGTLATLDTKAKDAGIRQHALILVGDAIGDAPGANSRLYDKEFSHGYRSSLHKKLDGPAVVALTVQGAELGKKILKEMQGTALFVPDTVSARSAGTSVTAFKRLDKQVELLFQDYKKIVFIAAAGIAVRMIAPHLKSKWDEPAVVVMDDHGKSIISLLSGHWGGANRLAQELADLLGGRCVITTASDVQGMPALDSMIRQLGSAEFPTAVLTKIQTAMVNGQSVGFYPEALRLIDGMAGHENLYFFDSITDFHASPCTAGIALTHEPSPRLGNNRTVLFMHPRDIVVGVGCNRGTSSQEIEDGIKSILKKLHLPISSLYCLCSIDAKKNEKGLCAYAGAAGVPLKLFSSTELNSVAIPSAPSDHAQRALGVQGVAEPAALLGSYGGKLLQHKVKLNTITLAVAQIPCAMLIRITEGHDSR